MQGDLRNINLQQGDASSQNVDPYEESRLRAQQQAVDLTMGEADHLIDIANKRRWDTIKKIGLEEEFIKKYNERQEKNLSDNK